MTSANEQWRFEKPVYMATIHEELKEFVLLESVRVEARTSAERSVKRFSTLAKATEAALQDDKLRPLILVSVTRDGIVEISRYD